MINPSPTPKEQLALTRFEVICHLRAQLQEGIPLAECLRVAATRPWPPESGRYFAARTLETWWYDYAKGGFTALAGKATRQDAGQSRRIDPQTGLWIIEAITKNPKVPLAVLYRLWQEQGRQLPSGSTVRRFLQAQGFDARSLKAGRLETGPTKAFEAPAPNDLWMVDFACGPTLRQSCGKVLSTHLCVIVDDHSRLITFGAYYASADTAAFLDCFKQAVLRRGLPLKLYTDQGKPFVSHHAKVVCANLGIRLLHAKPYHAWSKGKVERLIQTIQRDFEVTLQLDGASVHSLSQLNTTFARWIASTYHPRTHSSTGQTPHERFNAASHPLRPIEDPDKIDALFYTRLRRTVRKDSTVTLNKKLFEVPLSLRTFEIELRFDPSSASRWRSGTRTPSKGWLNAATRTSTARSTNTTGAPTMRADLAAAERPAKAPSIESSLRAWGLHRVPFSSDTRTSGLFETAAHPQLLSLLNATASLRGLMLLTGNPGAGKSALVKAWMAGLEPKRFLPLLITQSSLSGTGVLEVVLAKLGERTRFRRSNNLLALEKHLAELEPVTLVLVLDDAQNYPGPALEEIRLLMGLGGGRGSAFGLVLLGDAYLLDSLRLGVQRALFSRISASASLAPLSGGEIEGYLNWHVSQAGLEKDIFAPAAIDLLAGASEGNPRILGLLAQAAWFAAAAQQVFTTIEAEHVHSALRQVPSASVKIYQV